MFIKRVLILVFLIGSIHTVSAQKNWDLGIFLGTSYYLGDLNNSKQFHHPHFAYGGILRYNFGPRWSLRGSILGGGISGDDLDFDYKYQRYRKYDFFTPIVDITVQGELNFLPYRIDDERNNYSPYVHAGGTFLIASYAIQPYQFAIPFGVGFKFNLFPKTGMGIEWSFRKTFTDGLDKVGWSKHLPTTSKENSYLMKKQTGYFHQRDWYSFLGIFITYKLKPKGIECNSYR